MKKLKTLLATAVATVTLCALLPMAAFAAGEQTAPDIEDWGTVGSTISWEMHADGTLELAGTGEMGSWTSHTGKAYEDGFPYASDVKKVVVGENIIHIAGFTGCNMTEVSLPNSLKTAAHATFFDCRNLRGLSLPDDFKFKANVRIINSGCTSFENLEISCDDISYHLYPFDDTILDNAKAHPEWFTYRHDLVKVGFQPVVVADDGTSTDGHYAGLQCSTCKKFFTDETGTVDCTTEKTIPRMGVVGFTEEFRDNGAQTVGAALYTGKAIKPIMFVHTNGGPDLDPRYYDIVMPDSMVEIGTYDITINLHGNYKGQIHREFHIVGNMDDVTIEYLDGVEMVPTSLGVDCPSVVYCGKRPTRDMFIKCVKDVRGKVIPEDQWELTVSGEMPTPNNGYPDYTYKTPYYTYIEAAAGSNYRGTNNKYRLVIKKLDIWDKNNVSWPKFDRPFLYNPQFEGDFPKPPIEGTVLTFDRTLKAGTDFNVSYRLSDDGTMGIADMSVKDSAYYLIKTPGIPEYHIEYPIVEATAIDTCDISVADDCVYSGKACKPEVKIAVPKHEGLFYQEGLDYTVAYKSNVNAGTATAVVTAIEHEDGSNLLTGSTEIPFTIAPMKLSACSISVTPTLVYTGATQTPKVAVKTSTGMVMGTTAFTVGKTSSAAVGVTTFKITGKGNLTGSVTKSVTILPKATSITKLTRGSKYFVVKWSKRTAQTSGYQIRYSLKKSMKSAKTKTVSKAKTTSLKVSKLKAKKKYYVQVRTFKTVGKTKHYSAWSSVKSVTTK